MNKKSLAVALCVENTETLKRFQSMFENDSIDTRTLDSMTSVSREISQNKRFAALVLSESFFGTSALDIAKQVRSTESNGATPIFIYCNTESKISANSASISQVSNIHLISADIWFSEVAHIIKSKILIKDEAAAYDVRIINAFLHAAQEVMRHYLGEGIAISKPEIRSNQKPVGDFFSLIAFSGDGLKGSIGMSFEKEFISIIGQKIFQDTNAIFTNSALADMAGELANQVCGSVKLKFAKLGLSISLGIPSVFVGNNFEIVHIVTNPVILATLTNSKCTCAVEFCMVKDVGSSEAISEKSNENAANAGEMLFF